MRAPYFLMAMLFACLASVSCKKGKDDQKQEPPFKNERVKTRTWTGGGVANYTYDAQKRQLKEEQNTGVNTEYHFEPGKMIRVVKQSSITDSFVYELNTEGYVKTQRIPDGTIYTYEYSPAGMVTKEYSRQPVLYVATYFYDNTTGLLDSVQQTINGAWNGTSIYTYYTDKDNSLKNENTGLAVFGEKFLKPIKRQRSLYKDGNSVKEQIIDFTHIYDEKGRITNTSLLNSGQLVEFHYTYY
jgi:hypothetical protein